MSTINLASSVTSLAETSRVQQSNNAVIKTSSDLMDVLLQMVKESTAVGASAPASLDKTV